MPKREGVLIIATLCFSAVAGQFDPCNPNPCGPNTDCSAESAGVAKCRCKPGFFPKPDTITGCGPQCSVDTECRENQVCAANKCVNPCDQDICGTNAVCEVKQHRTLCKCPAGFSGDPFSRCSQERQISAERQVSSDSAGSSFGSERASSSFDSERATSSFAPERTASFDNQFSNNRPIAEAPRRPLAFADSNDNQGRIANSGSRLRDNFDPFSSSNRFTNSFSSGGGGRSQVTIGGGNVGSRSGTGRNECNAQCGTNARCTFRGILPVCVCEPGTFGDPYRGCQRGECQDNNGCASNQVCFELKCIDPCPTTCGVNAECSVRNHITSCRCPDGYTGDQFTSCTRKPQVNSRQNANGFGDLCSPTPCGPNTNCKSDNANVQAICSCLPGFIGDPIQGCRRECEQDFDCTSNLACIENRCQDPCFTRCGKNSDCQVRNNRAVCSCPENYIGDPYSECRPECVRHDDCPSNQACFNLRCVDPCNGACGTGADCRVNDHKAICSCPKGYTGHPFDRCRPFTKEDLCNPNPCGRGALCKPGSDRDGNDRPVCYCKDGFLGDPLIECRKGECVDNEDCNPNQACYGFKCVDPCRDQNTGGSVCGLGARCDARNHGAICSCPSGTIGDPLNECRSSGQRFGKKKK